MFAPTAAGGVRGDRPGVPRTPGSLESLPKPIQRRFGGIGIAPEQTTREEWLLTTGTGGYAMGTAPGIPARRYHGLLVASITPPVRRAVLLSEFAAEIDVPGRGRFALSTFHFAEASDTPTARTARTVRDRRAVLPLGLALQHQRRRGDHRPRTHARRGKIGRGRPLRRRRARHADALHLRPPVRCASTLQHEQPEGNDDKASASCRTTIMPLISHQQSTAGASSCDSNPKTPASSTASPTGGATSSTTAKPNEVRTTPKTCTHPASSRSMLSPATAPCCNSRPAC